MKNKPFIIGGIIACVLIIGGIIGFILAKGNSGNESLDGIEPVAFEEVSEDDAISEKEYMALLNEAFNYEDSIEYSDNKITGKDAVAKGVDRLGPAYREYLLDGTEDTPETRFDLVEKKGVLSKKFKDAYLSSTQAEALIKNFTALATIEDYHVSVSKYEAAEGVVDGSDWTATYYTSHEDGTEEALIEIKGDAPSVGEKLIYKDTVGVLRGGIISAIEKRDGNIYNVLTTKPQSLDDLLTDYTVAGYVDWSNVDAINTEDGAQVLDSSNVPNYSFVSTKKDKGIKTTVTVTGELTKKNNSSDGKDVEFKVTGFEIGGKDYSYLCETYNVTKDYVESLKKQGNSKEIEREKSVTIEMSLEDFQLYAYANKSDGLYYECLYKPVLKMGDASVNFAVDMPSIPVPLGIAEIELALGIHADLEMENIGIAISTEDRIGTVISIDENGYSKKYEEHKIVTNFEDEGLDDGNATVTFSGGVAPKATLKVAKFPLIAPKVDFYFQISAEQLDVVPGYETACWEAKAVGPLIDFYVTDDGDFSAAFLLAQSLKGAGIVEGTKIPILSEEDTNRLYYHLEFDDSPMIKEDPKHDASVCTHVAADGSRTKIRRHVDYTLPKSIDEIDLDSETKSLYDSFLNGTGELTIYNCSYIADGTKYNINDLINVLYNNLDEFDRERCSYDDVYVKYLDLGKDGQYEMLASFKFNCTLYDSNNTYNYIIKNYDGELRTCYAPRDISSLTRGYDIYYFNGLMYDSGSGGAGNSSYSFSYIDKDGQYHTWYHGNCTFVNDGSSEVQVDWPDDYCMCYEEICFGEDIYTEDKENTYYLPTKGLGLMEFADELPTDGYGVDIYKVDKDYLDNYMTYIDCFNSFDLQAVTLDELANKIQEQRQKIGLTDDIYYID
ncbi:MAG: hypothetical protein E7272_11505 [Pseudobutyrivibrio ruminis]|uniref:Uncharacterized protein n=1 Tax=Pseudobutyrivibrio ruminis TaxID=46206 RepID=A0A927U9E5_9FIRM|nr:hypothetical protein [Pseudobutyrivibrio ruminis]